MSTSQYESQSLSHPRINFGLGKASGLMYWAKWTCFTYLKPSLEIGLQNNSMPPLFYFYCVRMLFILVDMFGLDQKRFFQLLFLVLFRCCTQELLRNLFSYVLAPERFVFRNWASVERWWVIKPRKYWNVVPQKRVDLNICKTLIRNVKWPGESTCLNTELLKDC